MIPIFAVQRGVASVGGFALLLLAENVRPFRRLVDARWRRYTLNGFIAGSNALLLDVLAGGLIIGAYQFFELRRFGLLNTLGISGWPNMLATLVFLDVVTYFWHRVYHGVPVMWRMHRVHHSDRDVDVTTSARFHITEMSLSAVFRVGMMAVWGPVLMGVVLFEVVFQFFNQLEHSNVQLPRRLDRCLRLVVVTPAMHRVHHSNVVTFTNSNYGTIFSWWDRVFGTYRVIEDQQRMALGLPEYPARQDVTFGRVLAMPFGPPCGAGHRFDSRA